MKLSRVRTSINSERYAVDPTETTRNENRFQLENDRYPVRMSSAISTERLCVSYGEAPALSDVSLEIPAASSLAVIGPNGSGKSTLLGALSGTVPITSGSSSVAGGTPAFVLQATDVDRSLPITVWDTVALSRYPSLGLFKRFGSDDKKAIGTALERLAISDLASSQLHGLSGGQRQRVLVAQGLAQEAEVLLLDEPVTGLDVTSRSIILDLIDDEVTSGRTVVVTTHNLDEARRCDQVLLVDTVSIAAGTPDTVLTEKNLRAAFGGKFIKVGDEFMLDDPHHHH